MERFTAVRNYGLTLLVFLLLQSPSLAAITTELAPSAPSPSTLGTVISWKANSNDVNAGPLLYRFSAASARGSLQVVKDFSSSNQFDWTTIDSEGLYIIQVDVFNRATGEIATASSPYEMLPLAGQDPVISPTVNPLVFIYSAPPCANGGQMHVNFSRVDAVGPLQTTKALPCRSGSTMNFYLAGMQASSAYFVEHVVTQPTSPTTAGPLMELTTGDIPTAISTLAAAKQRVLQSSFSGATDWILLQGPLSSPPFATDLSGNIVWYYPQALSFLTRPDANGRFFGIRNGTDSAGSILRIFDLAGNTVQETNAAAINARLAALGKRQIGVFHHEARRLPNGNIVTLGGVEQILTDVQGPGPIDVMGDMIIVLDPNFQVVWTWDSFDYLDVTRKAVLGETCKNGGACARFLAPDANDWTHANSVQQTPEGNLLISLRHQDWVVKVAYENGNGDGHVIWRLGIGGDFTLQSDDPDAWFSHQHDPNFMADNVHMAVFDNGNTRRVGDPNATSRGQVLVVNEENRTVNLLLNQDLAVYSSAVGSAQRLPNGDYHFDAGFVGLSAISFEVTRTGNIRRAIQAGYPEYRTFRMPDLYSSVD